jgi:DNA-directed RNA polymerase subunit RPC12/RpoP
VIYGGFSNMSKECRKCGAEMEIVDRNHRELIEEVIEVYYRCPRCGYEIIVPEPVEKGQTGERDLDD